MKSTLVRHSAISTFRRFLHANQAGAVVYKGCVRCAGEGAGLQPLAIFVPEHPVTAESGWSGGKIPVKAIQPSKIKGRLVVLEPPQWSNRISRLHLWTSGAGRMVRITVVGDGIADVVEYPDHSNTKVVTKKLLNGFGKGMLKLRGVGVLSPTLQTGDYEYHVTAQGRKLPFLSHYSPLIRLRFRCFR